MTKKKENKISKVDVNELVESVLNIEENTFHKSLLNAKTIFSADQLEKAIADNGYSLNLQTEVKLDIESEIAEIESVLSETENSIILQALNSSLQEKRKELDNIQNKSTVTAIDFQGKIDEFFQTGLHGLKKKSMLVKTEVEAAASGTNAINYLFRQSLLNNEKLISVNSMLEKTTNILGKYYRSVGHVNVLCNALTKNQIVKRAYMKNKQIFISY